jgi:hypothetical protein
MAKKTTTKLRDGAHAAKAMLSTNGDMKLDKLEDQVDAFLEKVKKLDDAVWEALGTTKERLFAAAVTLWPDDKESRAPFRELKSAWKETKRTGTTVGGALVKRARVLKARAAKVRTT